MGKDWNEGFVGWISSIGIPGELGIVIAMAELIPGILLIIGVLSRISASIISIIMLGAIFHVKGAASLTGENGFEIDLILLASCLMIIVAGPGRVSRSRTETGVWKWFDTRIAATQRKKDEVHVSLASSRRRKVDVLPRVL